MAGRFLLCFMLLLYKPVICRITGPALLDNFVGDNARFRWNTDDNATLLSATWGIKKDNIADPQFINVDITSSKVNLNSDLEPNLMKRLSFDGDLKKGLAWFTLKNVTVNDSNTYIALISDRVNRVLHFTVVLTVMKNKEENEQSDVTTKEGNTSQVVPSSTLFPQIAKPPTRTETEANAANREPKASVHSHSEKLVITLVTIGLLVVMVFAVLAFFSKGTHLCKKKRNKSPSEGMLMDKV